MVDVELQDLKTTCDSALRSMGYDATEAAVITDVSSSGARDWCMTWWRAPARTSLLMCHR